MSYLRFTSIVPAGLGLALLCCSCASQEWVTSQINSQYNQHASSLCTDLDNRAVVAEQEMQKTMAAGTAMEKKVVEVTADLEELNSRVNTTIQENRSEVSGFNKNIAGVKADLLGQVKQLENSNQQKIARDIASLIRQRNKWLAYTSRVKAEGLSIYKGFVDRQILYQLAALPIMREYDPLNAKTRKLIDTSKDSASHRIMAMKSNSAALLGKLPLQELLFVYDALFNCRECGELLKGNSDQTASAWDGEGMLIKQAEATASTGDKKLQILVLNRSLVCDTIIRKFRNSQDYPLEMAYFIVQMIMADAAMAEGPWKQGIDHLSRSYIDKFNARVPVSKN